MREGAEFIASKRCQNLNLSYIVKRLKACSDKYGGYCENCPDLTECVLHFDDRCGIGEVVCRACNEQVPKTIHCPNCGELLKSKRIKKGKEVK